MATVEKNITLDEAVQKSKDMLNKGYLWIVDENILDLEVPHGCVFNCIGVTWFSFAEGYTVAAIFPATTAKTPNYMRGLKEDNSAFSNLEELRAAYPKLFEVTGDFNVMIL